MYEKVEMPDKIKNRYHYLEIPLLIGFQTNKNKVNIEIGTGVSFGFLVSANGKLPDLDNNSLLEINKNSDFLRNTSFNYILRAGIQYNINSSLSLIAKPYFKRNLNSVFKVDYPIIQKYTTFGIDIGVRIKL